MQRPAHNERNKSINLINHITPEKRRSKTTNLPESSQSAETNSKIKMVHEPKKVETGILVGMLIKSMQACKH